jgi:HK97 family phage portal protein
MNFISSALNSLFGTRGGRYFTMQQIGQTTPDWIKTTDLWSIYGRIPELHTVINKKANLMASANPKVCDIDGNVLERNSKTENAYKLIDRPAPMLTWGRMIQMTSTNLSVTGNALIYTPRATFGTVGLFNPIAWNNVKVHFNKKGYKQIAKSGLIEKFEIAMDARGTFETFTPEEVVYLFEPDGINMVNTVSKLDALKMALSNIEKQYEKRNVLLKNLFSLGMLSGANSDGMGALPVQPDDIKQVRDDFKKRHKGEVIISDKQWKFDPMTFPTRDLMLYEENYADFVTLCDAFGLKVDIFGNILGKGSTFANVDGAERQTYTGTIIPETEHIYDEITQQVGFDAQGIYIKPDFSHIDILKSDANKEATALNLKAQALEKIKNLGIELNEDEIRSILGI